MASAGRMELGGVAATVIRMAARFYVFLSFFFLFFFVFRCFIGDETKGKDCEVSELIFAYLYVCPMAILGSVAEQDSRAA